MGNLRAGLKAFVFGITLLSYFILTIPILFFFFIKPSLFRKILNILVSVYSKFLLKMMGLKILVKDESDARSYDGNLFISNHLSYLDILVLSSIQASSYVTSLEMKKTPLLGQICLLAGCVFVNRKNKKDIHNEIREITKSLSDGVNVTIFPEATSTNGERVLRFKRPLFQAAIDAKKAVIPLTINYNFINDSAVSLENRDNLFWYDDMTFGDHLWGVFKLRSAVITVNRGKLINVSEESDVVELSLLVHEKVNSKYAPIIS
jgi:1-acyl-sn-glycerol-3-phosphate acyltransferase